MGSAADAARADPRSFVPFGPEGIITARPVPQSGYEPGHEVGMRDRQVSSPAGRSPSATGHVLPQPGGKLVGATRGYPRRCG